MNPIVQFILIGLLPAVLIMLTNQLKVLKFIGPILLAYAAGIILANLPFIGWDHGLSMTISEAAVPVAIPMVLISTDLIKWVKLARTTVLSFVLMMVAAVLASLFTVLIFRSQMEESWKLAGMLTGCYTGGTPNMIAIGMGLEVKSTTLVLANTADMLWGGLYFILLTSVMKNVYRRFLPPFVSDERNNAVVEPFMKPIRELSIKHAMKNIALVVSVSVGVAGLSIGLSLLFTGGLSLIPILIMVTTFGIVLSFSKVMHHIEGTWNIAEYVILLFSIGLGGTVKFQDFLNASPMMLLYVGTIMMGALFIHFILCKISGIDSDTAMITSTAGIYGPAFIAPVAKALNNQEIVVSGLITGLAGYAVGNYLGLLVAWLMKLL